MPAARVFAGQALDPPWPGGSLYRCRRCMLGFRHPVREDAEYERLYESATEAVWTTAGLRSDQRLVADCIARCAEAGRVLDVGCYDGSLLASLDERWHKFGVEASRAAAERARRRGITIVAARIGDLPTLGERFDVVCAVDVIEHLTAPSQFVAHLAGLLRPGGSLILSTGTLDAAAWQAAGGQYWYGSFPEHLSFISPAWAQGVATELGLRVVELQRFAYGSLGGARRLRERLRFQRKLVQSRLARLLPRQLAPDRIAQPRSIGLPGLFEDHVLLRWQRAQDAPPTLPSDRNPAS